MLIAFVQGDRSPVLEPERHPTFSRPCYLGGPAVDELERLVVAAPSDPIGGSKLDTLGAIDLAAVAAFVIDPGNPALVALLDASPPAGPVEDDDIARCVVGAERLPGIGVAIGDQPLAL